VCAISSLTSTFAISSPDEFLSVYLMAFDYQELKGLLTYLLTYEKLRIRSDLGTSAENLR